ncbi:hypothetical protein CAEBREN_15211 [Caenorhabditis brenneri]|uniref:PAN-3 domain-containing protein n=1 Tax=Caenorhabditis brenneri TaxID=135651 RepID=G0NPC5_CAEBE|nr:hypothetical protein CAEBREN_15211 [Caenorhabditis brenneri]
MSDCFNNCFDESNCILAEFKESECALYDFLSTETPLKVIETEPGLLSFVAIKTTLPNDTCPVSFNMITLTFIDPNGEHHAWKNDNTEGFEFAVCQDNWKRFDRPNGISVCMKRVSLEPPANKTLAMAACQGIGASIIGAETREEVYWMADQSFDHSNPSNSWLDGERECDEICNKTYSNELTTGNILLPITITQEIRASPNKTHCVTVVGMKSLTAVNCTSYESPGVMCGYKLF